MRFGSVCSGIEAASVASSHLGWEAAWFSEIEPFPCSVLSHHFGASAPEVVPIFMEKKKYDRPKDAKIRNLGDMTTITEKILSGDVEAPELFVGGTPCQAFSVAGQRKGLEDARGNLTLTFCEISDAIESVRLSNGESAPIIFWENVPGVLSDKTNAFGCLLGELSGECEQLQPPGEKWEDAGCVYGPKRAIAWRTLDAQHFGLAQRRRRVFVVASSREGFDPAKVLFEFGGLRRDSAPSREPGQATPANAEGGAGARGYTASSFGQYAEGVGTIRAAGGDLGGGSETLAVQAYGWNGDHTPKLMAETSPCMRAGQGGEGYGVAIYPIDMRNATRTTPYEIGGIHREGLGLGEDGDPAPTLTQLFTPGVAIGTDLYNGAITGEVAATMTCVSGRYADASGPTVMEPTAFNWQSGGDCRLQANEGQANTLTCFQTQAVMETNVHGTLLARYLDGGFNEGNSAIDIWLSQQQSQQQPFAVRRLTPRECERLQGFPDDYTLVPHRGKAAADGPRYKALGNSWAVNCVRWIFNRIEFSAKPKEQK